MGTETQEQVSTQAAPVTEPPAWITIEEAAAHARCSKKVLYRAAKSKKIDSTKVNGTGPYRFRLRWVDEWLERTMTTAGARR